VSFWLIWELPDFGHSHPTRRWGSELLRRCGDQVFANVDQVVGDHSKTNPAPNSFLAMVSTTRQSMSSFQDADSAFTSRSPFLPILEPLTFL
jgi:hypothetical protein